MGDCAGERTRLVEIDVMGGLLVYKCLVGFLGQVAQSIDG